MKKRKEAPDKRTRDLKGLDLLPAEEALRRTEDLLRKMLNTPPAPRAKPKKRAK